MDGGTDDGTASGIVVCAAPMDSMSTWQPRSVATSPWPTLSICVRPYATVVEVIFPRMGTSWITATRARIA